MYKCNLKMKKMKSKFYFIWNSIKNNEVDINLEVKYGNPPNDALLAKKSLWPETN